MKYIIEFETRLIYRGEIEVEADSEDEAYDHVYKSEDSLVDPEKLEFYDNDILDIREVSDA